MKRSSVAVGFGVVAFLLALMLWTRPSRVHVERTARIEAPAAAIYARVSDFSRWPAWTPWRDVSRDCSPTTGIGAVCHGPTGNLTIVRETENARVDFEISFPRQMEETGLLSVVLAPTPEGSTDVTWSFDASTAFCNRGFGFFRNVTGRFDREFERALTALALDARPIDPTLR